MVASKAIRVHRGKGLELFATGHKGNRQRRSVTSVKSACDFNTDPILQHQSMCLVELLHNVNFKARNTFNLLLPNLSRTWKENNEQVTEGRPFKSTNDNTHGFI